MCDKEYYLQFYIVLIDLVVHYRIQGGTSQCHYLWFIGSLRPNRERISRLRKVCPMLCTSQKHIFYLLLIRSLRYSEECLGLHYGTIHEADLGDGGGRTREVFLARQSYFPIWGSCWESIAGTYLVPLSSSFTMQPFAGGQHFRAWKQNGTLANSGAWFIG
jgi:hypothetical protein